MDNIDVVAKQMINSIGKHENEEIKKEINMNDRIMIESIKKLNNPFRMIDVNAVMNDLNICKVVAYRLFQREDFPAIRIGKSNQVMLIAYIIWKMSRKEN